jgi:hypothetical protein
MSKTTGTTSEAETVHSSGTSGFSGALVDLYIKLIFYRMSNINNISNRMSAINETRPTVIQNHTERETKKKMYCF